MVGWPQGEWLDRSWEPLRVCAVQTAYANGGSTSFIEGLSQELKKSIKAPLQAGHTPQTIGLISWPCSVIILTLDHQALPTNPKPKKP